MVWVSKRNPASSEGGSPCQFREQKRQPTQRRQQSVQGEPPTGDNWSYNSYKWPKINGFSWGYFTLLLVPPSTANQFVSHPVMPPPTVGGGWEYYWPLFIVVQPTISSTGTLLVLLDTTCTTWYYMCVCVCVSLCDHTVCDVGKGEPGTRRFGAKFSVSLFFGPATWMDTQILQGIIILPTQGKSLKREIPRNYPNNALLQGKSLKTTIHIHTFTLFDSPKMGNLMIPFLKVNFKVCQVFGISAQCISTGIHQVPRGIHRSIGNGRNTSNFVSASMN